MAAPTSSATCVAPDDCVQDWTITILVTGACNLNAKYTMTWEVDCYTHDCPLPQNTVSMSVYINSADFCGVVIDQVDFTASLKIYGNVNRTGAEKTLWPLYRPDPGYFSAVLSSDQVSTIHATLKSVVASVYPVDRPTVMLSYSLFDSAAGGVQTGGGLGAATFATQAAPNTNTIWFSFILDAVFRLANPANPVNSSMSITATIDLSFTAGSRKRSETMQLRYKVPVLSVIWLSLFQCLYSSLK